MKHKKGNVIVLIVYNIVVIANDQCEINNLKGFLRKEYEIKDFGLFKYFLGIEITRSKGGIFLS